MRADRDVAQGCFFKRVGCAFPIDSCSERGSVGQANWRIAGRALRHRAFIQHEAALRAFRRGAGGAQAPDVLGGIGAKEALLGKVVHLALAAAVLGRTLVGDEAPKSPTVVDFLQGRIAAWAAEAVVQTRVPDLAGRAGIKLGGVDQTDQVNGGRRGQACGFQRIEPEQGAGAAGVDLDLPAVMAGQFERLHRRAAVRTGLGFLVAQGHGITRQAWELHLATGLE